MKKLDLDELIKKLKLLKELEEVRAASAGPKAVGDTLEQLVGLPRTNLMIPDWGIFELKASRIKSKSRMTLLSRVPKLVVSDLVELVQKHGYWSKKKMRHSLYQTFSARGPNRRKWVITIDELNDRLNFFHDKTLVAYENISELQQLIIQKAENLVTVYAESRKDKGVEYFKYVEAYLHTGLEVDKITDALRNHLLVYDWRFHLKEDGIIRDHGPGYRINPRKVNYLYSSTRRVVPKDNQLLISEFT
jgi:hypothetical protein